VPWIAVRDPKRNYYLDSPAATDGARNRWEDHSVAVGNERQGGQQFEINVVLLDQKTSDFVKSVTGYVGFATLPQGAKVAVAMPVTRSSQDNKPCG
jgi:hypothetical protein